MPPDEGLALHDAAARSRRRRRRCSRSAATAASPPSISAPRPAARDTVLFSVDHHRGSEENQAGWEWHEPDLVDKEIGKMDTLPIFRRTIHDAGLEGTVIAVVADSPTLAGTGRRRWRCSSSTAATAPNPRTVTTSSGRHTCERAACCSSMTCSPIPADGGRPPYEIYCRALESGRFEDVSATGSLRVLRAR